jgi:hypothetical protein
MKPGGLEVVAGAYNHTFIYLDEMSKATAEQVEFVMTIAQGQLTARMTELRRRIWCMPILSTSNRSVVELMMKLGLEFDAAYVDRLMDVPSPSKTCFVENLHGLKDIAAFAARTCQLAVRAASGSASGSCPSRRRSFSPPFWCASTITSLSSTRKSGDMGRSCFQLRAARRLLRPLSRPPRRPSPS